jgi:ribonuclease P protein component
MERLKRRADFLSAAKGTRVQTVPFLLQARDRRDDLSPRVGFTVTKKTGNAVERNRIRRRLRVAARSVIPRAGREGYDYVLVARRPALTSPFEAMLAELERALARLHDRKSGHGPARPEKPKRHTGDGDTDD